MRASADPWSEPYKRTRNASVKHYFRYARTSDLLETISDGGQPAFRIGQDGHAGRKRPAVAAEATVLSSMATAEFKHLFALREEMRSWRFLQLDAAGLRDPVTNQAPPQLEPSGWNLAAVLARIQAETATSDDPAGDLTDLSADLVHLLPGVRGIAVRENEQDRKWELRVRARDGDEYSGRVASDGTLRLLALITAVSDPGFDGVLCFEEPENGVHPARIKPLMRLLREVVTDPASEPPDGDGRLVQMLVATHSPVVVSSLEPGEGVFFDSVSALDAGDTVTQATRARSVRHELHDAVDVADIGNVVAPGEVNRYLSTAAR